MARETIALTDIGVVIVSHNSRGDLERSLPAVTAHEHPVVVVDNASTDGSPAFVRDRFPQVHVLELRENVGYGTACNIGIAETPQPMVLLLNPDAWPIGDGIEQLAACARREPTIGAAGPLLQAPSGRRQQSLLGFPTQWWLGRPAITSTAASARVGVLPWSRPARKALVGAALLVRREAIEQVGGFDESFFMFYEEVDLCWRLQKAGWGVELCPEATFVHVGGTSTRRSWDSMYREQLCGHLRFVAKHHGLRRAENARRVLVVATAIRRGAYKILRRSEEAEATRVAATWLRTGSARSLLESPSPRGGAHSHTT